MFFSKSSILVNNKCFEWKHFIMIPVFWEPLRKNIVNFYYFHIVENKITKKLLKDDDMLLAGSLAQYHFLHLINIC